MREPWDTLLYEGVPAAVFTAVILGGLLGVVWIVIALIGA